MKKITPVMAVDADERNEREKTKSFLQLLDEKPGGGTEMMTPLQRYQSEVCFTSSWKADFYFQEDLSYGRSE